MATYDYAICEFDNDTETEKFLEFSDVVSRYYLPYYNGAQDLAYNLSRRNEYEYHVYDMTQEKPAYLGKYYNGKWEE